ncbi:unnamed protein product [Diatraea saccharalis]|uniref:Lipase n=1 Tax=Diatraea saccharalis TaxID=40085 RepID=A0A9N9QZI3_9NEOP|nr:unnamed protein product [Diatraea saccharalis]
MLQLIFLSVLVGAAVGGQSPNAQFVQRTYGSNPKFSSDILEDATLDVPGLVTKYGYPIEIHEVTTSDGYKLTMHRIPYGRAGNNDPNTPRPIVFLMHGLLSSSADFLVLGPGNALGYHLADEGYDVWLGNARGNFYSRRHKTLNPDARINQNFWRFSWDEIGNRDLPAFIDHILATTKQSKLHYIGHSQGGTSFLVLTSLRPQYNEKFISFQGLAPASFFTNNDDSTITSLASMEGILEPAAFALGMGEVFGDRDFISWLIENHCSPGSILESFCGSLLVTGRSEYFNETMEPIFMGHAPAGASVRQFAHYGQVIRFGKFRRFNHNRLTNLATYGSFTPPEYKIERITTPSYIHYATADTLVHPKDAQLLCSKLPNLKGCYLVQSETFDHYDFIWGNRAKIRVYEKVLRLMREAEQN